MWVKSTVPYSEFISHRDTENSVHREDLTAGECCGWVDESDLRDTDTSIDREAYDALVQEIQAYNAGPGRLPEE